MDQDELVGIQQGPEQVLQAPERVGIRLTILRGLLVISLRGRIPAQGREVESGDHVDLGRPESGSAPARSSRPGSSPLARQRSRISSPFIIMSAWGIVP